MSLRSGLGTPNFGNIIKYLQANLDEVREQEKKTRTTLARVLKAKAA